jgi:hypothetical protein
VRLLLFSCLALCCAACTAKPKPGVFVLNVAIPGLLEAPDGTESNGYGTVVEDWIFEPVLRVAEDGSTVAGLASTREKLPDGRVRLAIRDGATFSDGSPVTPEDVARSLKLHGLSSEISNGTLIVNAPAQHIPTDALLPIIAVSKTVGADTIGSGPFTVVEHDSGHMLLRRRVPSLRNINEIRLTSYANDREAMAHVLRGDANLLLRVQARDVEFFEGIPHLQVVSGPSPQIVALNLNTATLSRVERIELAHFFSVSELINTAFDQSCKAWPRASHGGALPPGRPLKILTLDADPELGRLGLALRRSLAERGELKLASVSEVVAELKSANYDITTVSPLIWPFGMAAVQLHSGGPFNTSNYSNPAVDAALEAGDWLKTLDELDKDPPLIFLCKRDRVVVLDSRIKNPTLGPWGLLERLPDWEVGE